MSATQRSDVRRESDAYMTDPKLARFIVELLRERCFLMHGARVLEPSAGDGAFLRPLFELIPDVDVIANEIYPERIDGWLDVIDRESCTNFDFEKFPKSLMPKIRNSPLDGPSEPSIYDGFDAVIGNPPYSFAEAHVRKALSLLAHGGTLAFLLRLAFLESRERIPFWKDHPAHSIFVLAERPSFTGGGSDSTAYGVFVWKKGVHTHSTKIEVVSWGGAERKPRPKK